MKKLILNFIVVCILFAICNICNGSLISVESYTDSNGFFRYTVNKGNEPFLFGGASNLCFQVQSYSASIIYDPFGWQSTMNASGLISWKFTNQIATTIDLPIQFSMQCDVIDFVNYDQMEQSANYPLGIIFGDVYNTNNTIFSPAGGTTFSSSVNVVGYERFEFVGPVIPEPSLYLVAIIGVVPFAVRLYIDKFRLFRLD